jgi:hypothetical protein
MMGNAQMCVLVNLLIVYFGFNITFDMDCFRVGSVNVNGAREGEKRASIFETAKIKKFNNNTKNVFYFIGEGK